MSRQLLLALFFVKIVHQCPCKINLLLNILEKRPDGFHELETVMYPLPLFDTLELSLGDKGIELLCDHPELETAKDNLVHRAAVRFFTKTGLKANVRISLQKRIPLAAGLGGGSSNAAHTLLALNELFGQPLTQEELTVEAAFLGSDVPFFLADTPALGFGRGERIERLSWFPSLQGSFIILVHPGFGVSTAWAYRNLTRFPEALNGIPGRAARCAEALKTAPLADAVLEFYNSLEAPVLEKYPILALFQEFFRETGALASRMSGSGSVTYAIVNEESRAREIVAQFESKFGNTAWKTVIPL